MFVSVGIAAEAQSLRKAYAASAGGSYQSLTAAELDIARNGFIELLNDPRITNERQNSWARLGFQLRMFNGVLILAEKPNARRGGGFFAFATAKRLRHVLQAPHRFDDTNTGIIALDLFLSGHFRAAAWATLHRADIDLAHTPSSLFVTFAEAAAVSHPQELQYQIHGFAAHKCKTSACAEAPAILSPGPLSWNEAAESKVTCLSQSSLQFKRYRDDVHELGGTRNSVASALFALNFQGFIHIEMERALRDQLIQREDKDADSLRNQLLRCLAG